MPVVAGLLAVCRIMSLTASHWFWSIYMWEHSSGLCFLIVARAAFSLSTTPYLSLTFTLVAHVWTHRKQCEMTTSTAAAAAWWSNPVTESVLSARQAVPACCNAFLLLSVCVSVCSCVCPLAICGHSLSVRDCCSLLSLFILATNVHWGGRHWPWTRIQVDCSYWLCCTGIGTRVDVVVVAHVAASLQSDIHSTLEPQNCSATPSSWTPPPESRRCRRVTRSRSRRSPQQQSPAENSRS